MGKLSPGRRTSAVVAALVAASAMACESPTSIPADAQPAVAFLRTGTGGLGGLAKSVRQATAPFHSTVQAAGAGYAEASGCVAVPGLGAMGFHWLNGGLVDPVFDPYRPEAFLYEPGPEGQLHLVAVEYIVIDVGQPAPTFDGHPFDVGGTPVPVPHWSLHAWVHKENPNGLFTPFNPAVSCP